MGLHPDYAWSAARVLAFLDDHAITVRLTGGRPELVRHPSTPARVFAAWAAAVLPHLAVRRAEVLAELSALDPAADSVPDPRVGSAAFRRMDPRARRAVVIRKCLALSRVSDPPGKACWVSWYTKKTGVFCDPAGVDDTATRAYVLTAAGDEVFSAPLPASVTPHAFREPADRVMPPDFIPGPKFKPYKTTRQDRRAWFRRNWHVASTFADCSPESLPPD